MRLFFWAFLLGGLIFHSPVRSDEGREGWTLNLMLENDLFGSDTDRHYTHGTRISLAPPPGEVPDVLANLSDKFPFFDGGGKLQTSFALGQNIYTPADISLSDPNQMDRPYAGWLYGSMGLVSVKSTRTDTFELSLGVVGPASLADRSQTFVHKAIDSQKPMGWDHQLKNEPGLIVSYERKWPRAFKHTFDFHDFGVDMTPHTGLSLGNIHTYGEAGAVFRFGQGLKNDPDTPPRIRPSLPGSDYFKRSDDISWYFFAGGALRLVGRNIFLDGNSFTDSQSVDKNLWVGDVQIGAALKYQDWRLAYTQIIRTKEFEGQNLPDRFGAITLSYNF